MSAAMWLKGIGVGVLATLSMDLGATLLRTLGLTAGLRPQLIARWFGHLVRGRLVHDDITKSADVPGQLPLTIVSHYCIGITLTLAFVLLLRHGPLRIDSRAGVFAAAVGWGALTNVLPWLLMFPAMGLGWFGNDGPAELLLLRTSFANHLAFGIGLGMGSMWVTSLWNGR